MKWKELFWLLLVANVLLFGWIKLSEPVSENIPPGHEQIAPERMKLLAPEEVESLPKTESSAPAPLKEQQAEIATGPTCYQWGNFTEKYIERAREAVKELKVSYRTEIVTDREATRYWVYIPPLASLEAAQKRNEELHGLGVNDTFILKDDAQWRNAISIGVFKDESLAEKLVNEMRARGINDATKTARHQEGRLSMLSITNVPPNKTEALYRLKPEFPESELKQVTCR
ncbi:MAG: SPOR domain-containing protein [Methylobacillus sp.]|jgi:cell division septation protein DedD|nr:SPOR domain-containing protein [Methylobacillus sp.]